MSRPKILVITPIDKINGIRSALDAVGDVHCLPDPSAVEVAREILGVDALFTNPNKSKVYLSKEILGLAPSLKVVCTASTGTNHIDLAFANQKGIRVLSITEERDAIDRISSTAEHAFALFLSALRKVPQGWDSVKRGEWDYEPFVGRQVSALTVGVIGYGRLGRFFAHYAKAFGAKVLAYDPYKKDYGDGIEPVGLDELLRRSDVVSLHVHVTPETTGLLNADSFKKMKPNALIVNTSRGEIVDEAALVAFLKGHAGAVYATDVLTGETQSRLKSPVFLYRDSGQVLVTPHVGGMTREAQEIAYTRAVELLSKFFLAGGKS